MITAINKNLEAVIQLAKDYSVNILNELRTCAQEAVNHAMGEIEDYLSDSVAQTTENVLGWWSRLNYSFMSRDRFQSPYKILVRKHNQFFPSS
ncbi:unnamed protein product [Gordionus sp. m RMFG-2023]